MESYEIIDIADIIRLAHLATFKTQINSDAQLTVANEIIKNGEAPAYVVIWCKWARKHNPRPVIIWLSNLPIDNGEYHA